MSESTRTKSRGEPEAVGFEAELRDLHELTSRWRSLKDYAEFAAGDAPEVSAAVQRAAIQLQDQILGSCERLTQPAHQFPNEFRHKAAAVLELLPQGGEDLSDDAARDLCLGILYGFPRSRS